MDNFYHPSLCTRYFEYGEIIYNDLKLKARLGEVKTLANPKS
jgi:hypothetical protein